MWPPGSKICLRNLKIYLKPYLRPLMAWIGPHFRFRCYFLSVIKNKRGWYIPRGNKHVFFEIENEKNLLPFYSITKFYKIGWRAETSGRKKIQHHKRLQDQKLHLFNRGYLFLRPKFWFTSNRNCLSHFGRFFCKSLTIFVFSDEKLANHWYFFLFRWKKESLKKSKS